MAETATATRERPILFSAEMVRAILDNRKSMTRRIVKDERIQTFAPGYADDRERIIGMCPYGQPGDRLWVRETTWYRADDGFTAYFDGALLPRENALFNKLITPLKPPEDEWPRNAKQFGFKTVPAIHMPRRASRLTLELTEVRVERVQDISEDDAIAEGADIIGPDGDHWANYREAFEYLWNKVNGDGSWNSNPWVWVLAFRKL